jgi:hypothetical protein
MPIQRCTLPNGEQGWQWGNQKCYPTRAQAERQATAIYASGYTGKIDLGALLKYDPNQARDERGRWSDEQMTGAADPAAGTPHAASIRFEQSDFKPSEALGGWSPVEQSMADAEAYTAWPGVRTGEEAKELSQLRLKDELVKNADWRALMAAMPMQSAPGLFLGPADQQQLHLRSEDAIRQFVSSWAVTSADHDPRSLFLQEMVKQEFGLRGVRDTAAVANPELPISPTGLAQEAMDHMRITASPEIAIAGTRAFLREMYSQTQADLAKAGLKEVTLMRGIVATRGSPAPPGYYKVTMNPMSSFSAHADMAADFAGGYGNVLLVKMPASRILSTPRTGFGCLSESEFVVLGGKTDAIMLSPNAVGGRWDRPWPVYAQAEVKLRDEAMGKALSKTDQTIDVDADQADADWTKTAWDLPPYKSPEFMRLVRNLAHFKTLPVYRHAVKAGLIADDLWVGQVAKYDDAQPRDDHGRWTNEGGNAIVETLLGSTEHHGEPLPSGDTPVTSRNRNVLIDMYSAQQAEALERGASPKEKAAYWLMESILLYRQKDIDAGTQHKLVVENGRIVSGVQYTPAQPGREHDIEVDYLFSLKEGEGSRLLKEVEQVAASKGVGVFLSAMPKAEEFYRRHGYVPDPTQRKTMRNELTIMEKDYRKVRAGLGKIDEEADDFGALACTPRLRRARAEKLEKFREDQQRDELGRWTDEGGPSGMAGKFSAINIRNSAAHEGKRMSVDQIAAMFSEGGPVAYEASPKDPLQVKEQVAKNFEHAVQTATEEIKYQLLREEVTGKGDFKRWYTDDIKTAMEITQKYIPSLSEPVKQQLFGVVAGITANGTDPMISWNTGAKIFREYERTGRLPPYNPQGEPGFTGKVGLWTIRGEYVAKGMGALNTLVERFGEAGAVAWLYSDHTNKELHEAEKDLLGSKGKLVLKTQNQKQLGLSIFGPKIGPFISNMHGIEDPVVDKWMTRTFARYFKQASVKDKNGKMVAISGPTAPMRRASKALINEVASRTGLKASQVQAGLWFHEQNLYTHLGAKSTPKSSSDGARRFADWVEGKVGKFININELLGFDIGPPREPTNDEVESLRMLGSVIRMRLGIDDKGGVMKTNLSALLKGFDPDQPRDAHGMWTDAGGGASASEGTRAAVVARAEGQSTLTAKQSAIEFALAQKLGMTMTGTNSKGEHEFKVTNEKAFTAAIAEYHALAEKDSPGLGGRVLNTDIARELSPDYLADRTQSAAVHEPASLFIKELYARMLAEPVPGGMHPVVLFTAGGTGAGKSSGMKLPEFADMVSRANIIYDTNMNTLGSAEKKVMQALDSGRQVGILYVHRDPVDALVNGALPRAAGQEREFGTGRTVPITEHAKTHAGALPTVRALYAKYNGSGNVWVRAVDNSLGRGNAKEASLDKWTITSQQDMERKLYDALEQQHEAGKISDSIYRGFKGDAPAKNASVDGRGLNGSVHAPGRTRLGKGDQQVGEAGELTPDEVAAIVSRTVAELTGGVGLRKEFVQSASATSGLTAYGNTGKKKKKRRETSLKRRLALRL